MQQKCDVRNANIGFGVIWDIYGRTVLKNVLNICGDGL